MMMDQTTLSPSSGLAAVKPHPPEAKASTVWFMAVSVGVIVANIYYAQPLLADIAASFGLTVPQVASVAMLTQLGAAVGMVLFVPLGDTRNVAR